MITTSPPLLIASRPVGKRAVAVPPRRAIWGMVLVGAALRVRQYASGGSLWIDEARLALDVEHTGFLRLLRPLDLLQGAPYGYLWSERLCLLCLGNSQYSLRLVSLIAGLATLLLFARLALRTLGGWAAVLAMAIVALSPSLIQYSSQVKPYGDDVVGTVAVLLVGMSLVEGDLRARRVAAWSALCAGVVLFSFGAVFAIGATAIFLMIRAARRRTWGILLVVAGATLPSVAIFLTQYLVAIRPIDQTRFMRSFWEAGYDPSPTSACGTASWLVHEGASVLGSPIDLLPAGLAAGVLVVGLVALARSQRPTAALLGLVVILVLGAGIAGGYPFDGRMVLFLVPVAALILASVPRLVPVSAAAAAPVPGRRWLLAGAGAAALSGCVLTAALPAGARTVDTAIHPSVTTAFEEAYGYARQHGARRAPVYVNGLSEAVFVYYRPLLHLDPRATLSLHTGESCNESALWDRLAPTHRFWVVLGIPWGPWPGVPAYVRALRTVGTVTYHPTSFGAGAALVRVDDRRLFDDPRDPGGCLSAGHLPTYASLARSLDPGRVLAPR